MLEGKTHDLLLPKGDVLFYKIISVVLFSIGIVLLFASLYVGWLGKIFVGGLGLFFAFLGGMLFWTSYFNKYTAYGINISKRLFWEAECMEGKGKVNILCEIPFSSVSTILLAPLQSYVSYGKGPISYFLVPCILMVFKDEGEEKVQVIRFKNDEDADRWVQTLLELGYHLDVTDEAINYIMYHKDGPHHIKNEIPKKPLNYNGDISTFINRKNRSQIEFPHYHAEKEKNSYDFSKVVHFPIDVKKVLSWHFAILLLIAIIDHTFVLLITGEGTGNLSIVGLVALLITHSITFFLIGYGMDYDYIGFYVGFSSFTALFWFLFIDNILVQLMQLPNLSEQFYIEIILFLFLAFPLAAIVKFIRKKKPAEHHLHIKKKREMMRNKDTKV